MLADIKGPHLEFLADGLQQPSHVTAYSNKEVVSSNSNNNGSKRIVMS